MKIVKLHQRKLVFLSIVYLGGFQNFLLYLTPGHGEGYYLVCVEYLRLMQYLKSIH